MDFGTIFMIATVMYGAVIYLCGLPHAGNFKTLSGDSMSRPVEFLGRFVNENQTDDLETIVYDQSSEFMNQVSLSCKGVQPICIIYEVIISFTVIVFGYNTH